MAYKVEVGDVVWNLWMTRDIIYLYPQQFNRFCDPHEFELSEDLSTLKLKDKMLKSQLLKIIIGDTKNESTRIS